MRFLILIIITGVVFLSSVYALALNNEDEFLSRLSEMELEELMALKVEEVYGASRYEQKTTEAPSSITIITADEIKKMGYKTIADLLHGLRGIFTTHDRDYKYINLRGFGLPGDYNTRVLILINGVRVNDSIFNAAVVGYTFPLDIDLVEKVEVIRGPGSSLYGSNAFFGVINVVTKDPEEIDGIELSSELGSFDSYKGRVSFGKVFSDEAAGVFSLAYYDSQGQDLYFPEYDSPSTNFGVADERDYERFLNFYSKFTYRDLSLQVVYHYRKKGVPTAPWDSVFNSDVFTLDKYFIADLKYEYAITGTLSVLLRATYSYSSNQGDYPSDWGPPEGVVVNRDIAKGKSAFAEILTYKQYPQHKLLAGIEYTYNFQLDQLNYDEGYRQSPNLDERHNSKNWSVYVQDEWEISPGVLLNGGLRYDRYDIFGSSVNPRLALIYMPEPGTSLKFIYGTAFRAPSAYELYYHDGYITQRPPDHLEPEEITTYEVSWEQFIWEHIKGLISVYYYRTKNLIALKTDPQPPLCDPDYDGIYDTACLVYDNINQAEGRGVEMELKGRWSSGIETALSYSYQYARDSRTDRILLNMPEHLGKVHFILPLYRKRLFLATEGVYVGKRRSKNNTTVSEYFVLNLNLYGFSLNRHLEASFSVYNLLNRKFYDPASEELYMDRLEQDGRTFRVKVTYKF